MITIPAGLRIDRAERDGATLVSPHGVLDLASYAELRDSLIKCAIEQPRAVLVDLGSLRAPTQATLSVFTVVWMRVSDWPGVPIVLIVADPEDRRSPALRAIARFVPVRASVAEALDTLDEPPPRRRGMIELPQSSISASVARRFVGETCDRWGCVEVRAEAIMVASELVENAVRHAHSAPRLRLELRAGVLSVAVYDDDPTPAQLVAPAWAASRHLGLALTARLARMWNCSPTWSGGKVVWAVLRCVDRTR